MAQLTKMNLKLFYSPPKWLAFVPPEKPELCMRGWDNPCEDRSEFRELRFVCKCRAEEIDYEKAYAEAKANALEVGNVESIKIGDIQENGAFIFPHEVQADRDYDWKGSAVIKDGKYILSI